LQVFEKEFSERFGQIIKLLNISLTSYQKFVIWIFGVDNNFDAFDYVTNNQDVINDYFKIKFLLRYKNDNKNVKIDGVFDLIKITQNALIKFAVTYKWNGLLYPTENFEYQQINSYLSDIDTFNKIFSQNLDVPEIAQCIYESMEKYNEIHLRLWLYGHLDNTFYNFIGFRNSFKKLTSEEQKSFRVKAIRNSLIEISNEEMMEVIPCSKFDLNTDGSKTYFAVMENLYFSLRHIKLRKENGLFTELFDEPFSSSGLNRIPSNHYLNKIPFQIIVNSNTIISTLGLDKLFITIHTGEIEKALGGVIDPSDVATVEQKSAYVEDMPLRKKIIDFLNQNQVSSMIPTIVIEPKNHFRRLDSNSIIDIFEKTELITIETIDGFGIVWENIDLSGDRATYIFKTLAKNHHLQIEKISHAIVSQAQLRSTLSSTKDDDLLHVFKDDLGYIGSLRKQRGKNDAFENWLKKFEKVLKEPIPELPSVEDSEKLKDWSPENDHHAKITKPRQKKINEDSLATIEMFEIAIKNAKSEHQIDEDLRAEILKVPQEDPQEGKITQRKSLLNSLKLFNEYFTENLNLN
jgi:hypothetical protein